MSETTEIIEVEVDHALAHKSKYRSDKVAALIELLDDVSYENGRNPYEYRNRKWCLADAIHLQRLIHKLASKLSSSRQYVSELRKENSDLQDKLKAIEDEKNKEAAERKRYELERVSQLRRWLKEKTISPGLIDNLVYSVIPDAEEWEFSRYDFVSAMTSDCGDPQRAEIIANSLSKVVKIV
jgi:hypothetical protein